MPDMSLNVVLANLNEGVDPKDFLNLSASFPITTEVPKQVKNKANQVQSYCTCTYQPQL